MGDALEDWLAHGTDGLSERTVTLYRGTSVKSLLEQLGRVRLTELSVADVRSALDAMLLGGPVVAEGRALRGISVTRVVWQGTG